MKHLCLLPSSTERAPPAPQVELLSLEMNGYPKQIGFNYCQKVFGGIKIKDIAQLGSDAGHLPEVILFQQASSFPGRTLPSKGGSCHSMVSYQQKQA